jgi:prepilin-type N-terminal cleavage/methylation domain-containing protein
MKSRGFTLIEVTISIAVAAITALAFGELARYFAASVTSSNQSEEVSITMSRITDAFGDSDNYCEAILGDLPLSPTQVTPVDKIDFHNASGVFQSNIVTTGGAVDNRPDLTVQAIQLRPLGLVNTDPNTGEQTIVANLEVIFARVGAPGSSTMIRSIPIWSLVEGGKISICSTSPANSFTVQNLICQIRNGGYAYYDPSIPDCQPTPQVTWFSGASASQASCPAGMVIATELGDSDPASTNCQTSASSVPLVPPRTYSNGVIDNSPQSRAIATINTLNTSCSFIFILGTDTSSITTQVRCRPKL